MGFSYTLKVIGGNNFVYIMTFAISIALHAYL